MIDEIHVQNVALISEATLIPSAGLTVITGETGAGKTALLSACKLLMGARGDKTIVREGAAEAKVEGRFFLEADQQQEQEFVVTRRLSEDGRSRVSINGSMASVGELAETIGASIDLCGQHEHQALMTVAHHASMLDAWSGDAVAPTLAAYQSAYAAASEAHASYERILSAAESSAGALEEARRVYEAIDAVDPREGEYEDIIAQLARTEHAEALARCSHTAAEALSAEQGALDALEVARQSLTEAASYDATLAPYADSLQESIYVIEDVARDMAGYVDDIEFDPAELAAMQERAAAYQGLLRTYGSTVAEVIAKRDEAAELIAAVDEGDERVQAAKAAWDAAEEALSTAGQKLHEARSAAAPQFAAAVTAVMGRLEMGSASLSCNVALKERDAWTAAGPDAVEFLFSPGQNLQARPLVKIASGGEISRVMLSIKTVMGEQDRIATLVFDEVDAGVGGATAVALAGVLADLAQTHQVLVVTHLAQVAAVADTHYIAQKDDGDNPQTTLTPVEGDVRVSEIARMLSGATTDNALAHARELLEKAHS